MVGGEEEELAIEPRAAILTSRIAGIVSAAANGFTKWVSTANPCIVELLSSAGTATGCRPWLLSQT